MNPELSQAYQYCHDISKRHYENFPVASLLLPKKLRRAVSVIYAFARTADDIADEGNDSYHQRLAKLDDYRQELDWIIQDSSQGQTPIFIALGDVIKTYAIPYQPFIDLLSAFKQDMHKQRYQTQQEIITYCQRSANPIGRLLLHLDCQPSEQQLKQSDAICTALQLINFYQDIRQDYIERNRIYISLDELDSFNIKESDLINPDTLKLAPLLRQRYQNITTLLNEGWPLGLTLKGRLGWQVRTMILAAIYILNKLKQQHDHRLLTRPTISEKEIILLATISTFPFFYRRYAAFLFGFK